MTSSAAAFNALSRRHDWEQFCDPTLAFDHGDHARVLEIWRAQAGADIPARSAMSARLLKPFLPQIGLVERVATDPPRYRWRLLGTGAVQVLGERTGTCFEDNASPRQAARWNASASLVLELRRPLRFVARVAIEGKEFPGQRIPADAARRR
ncbi:MAG: hypothetical protein WDM81_12870 [Rhizomicrobium sp.]